MFAMLDPLADFEPKKKEEWRETDDFKNAVFFAERALDDLHADPDDDLRTLARQFNRMVERYDQIFPRIESVKKKVAAAFGGCTKCYGKGYATVLDFSVGHEDFGNEGFIVKNNPMRFCSCSRGQQLQRIVSELTKK